MTAGQRYVREHEPEILEAMVAKAINGSVAHAKFALEYAWAAPGDAASESEEEELPGPSLAEILLKRLAALAEEPEEEEEGAQIV